MPKDYYVLFDDMLLAIEIVWDIIENNFDELRADFQNALLECRDDQF